MSFGDIWKTLSAVDCSEHVEKKMGLSYLSWAWAWGILMEHYPEATFEVHEEKFLENGTAECRVTVTIDEHSRTMWLPVMDHKNNAIPNPNTRHISDTRMRCLVKCLALFGLGHYIFGGEDLPSKDKESITLLSDEQRKELLGLVMQGNIELDKYLAWLGYSSMNDVRAEHYEKAKKALLQKIAQLGNEYAEEQTQTHISEQREVS